MEKIYLPAILAVFLFFSANGIQAQTLHSQTIQPDLTKQLHSNLPPEIKPPFDENKHQLLQGFKNLQNPEILKTEKANQLKSATVDGQQLDSMITETWIDSLDQWKPMMKEEFLYNENGNKTFHDLSWWDNVNRQWVDSQRKTQYIYESNGNMTESYFHLSPVGFNECNHHTTYDSMGNNTLVIWYNRQDSTEQWQQVFGSKYEYNYNANGKITLLIAYQWTIDVNEWVASLKDEYIYDGNMMYSTNYEWDSKTNLWVVFSVKQKFEYTYNESGNQTLRLNYFWDVSSNQWILKYKTENTYDLNENITSEGSYFWDETKSQWVGNLNGAGYSKGEWTYDSNSNVILHLTYDWNYGDTSWVAQAKEEWKYDDNANMIMHLTYDRNKGDTSWVGRAKEEYSYDNNGNTISSIVYIWGDTISQWIATTKTSWYYSEHNYTFIPNTPTPHLTVYPNPTKDFVVFGLPNSSESATVELYDIQGKKVFLQKLTGTKQITVGKLPKGLYLYRLTDGETVYTGKLVVE